MTKDELEAMRKQIEDGTFAEPSPLPPLPPVDPLLKAAVDWGTALGKKYREEAERRRGG